MLGVISDAICVVLKYTSINSILQSQDQMSWLQNWSFLKLDDERFHGGHLKFEIRFWQLYVFKTGTVWI